jgi:hypothetical protein
MLSGGTSNGPIKLCHRSFMDNYCLPNQIDKNYWISLIPAIFMTAVVSSYLIIAPEGFSLPNSIAYFRGLVAAIASVLWFFFRKRNEI